MNFFCMESCFDKWIQEMDIDNELYFKLDINDALVAAKMIFRVDE